MDDGITPVEAARQAQEMLLDRLRSSAFSVEDIETGYLCVVNTVTEQISEVEQL
jgi:hypothetical protein